MAQQVAHDVVKDSQSMGASPIDDSDRPRTNNITGGGGAGGGELQRAAAEQTDFHENPSGIDNLDGAGSSHAVATSSESEQALVNGDHRQDSAIGHDSASTTSDADKPGDADARHERSNSLAKKPAAFKAVSVTKNFLAKTASGALPISKPSVEKPLVGSPSPAPISQSPKPRLVTKSWREGRSLNAAAATPSAGAPDASKVWNRNKPTPVPPPKQFTDEELKQQYGIHLATRLQADEEGTKSKWADLDEEDEDWAPETVEWMDGTKSTILPTEHQAPQVAEAKPPIIANTDEEAAKPTEEPIQAPSGLPAPGKTILRPGAARQGSNSMKPGLILKNVPENQSSASSRAAAQASTKSPWASLPPVDKASPITFHPPPEQQPHARPAMFSQDARFPPDARSQDARSGDSVPAHAPPNASPAREIAADDFDRSWRGNERGPSQLFDSRSGRYEPVKNARRPSIREDQSGLRPSVLQRPSQGQNDRMSPDQAMRDQRAPDERQWARRQSPFESRSDIQRRDSQVLSTTDEAVSIGSSQAAKPVSVQASPSVSNAQPAPESQSGGETRYSARASDPAAPAPTAESEDVRVEQQRLMREKIEFNRKRKQEEEAREEAARKERIRAKMEALGPAPQKPAETPTKQLHEQPSQTLPLAKQPSDPEKKPNSDLQHYLRDHALDTRSSETRKDNRPDRVDPQSRQQLPQQRGRDPREPTHLPNAIADAQPSSAATLGVKAGQAPDGSLGSTFDRPVPSWNGIGPSAHPPPGWAASSLHAHANPGGNVWGAPNNDKSLGNGAFEGEIQGLPSIHLPQTHPTQRNGPLPAPIGPPSTASPMVNPQSSRTASSSSPLYGHLSGSGTPSGIPNGPIAPPVNIPASSVRPVANVDTGVRGWNNYAATVPQQEEAERQRRLREPQAPRQAYQPMARESFGRTASGQDPVLAQHAQSGMPMRDGPQHMVPGQTPSQPGAGTVGAQPHLNGYNRGSRFFGPPERGTISAVQPTNVPQSPSPPPPDSFDHPAFDSTSTQPRVRLATSVKVKLPPSRPTSTLQAEPVVMPPHSMPFRNGPQPIAATSEWQLRINGLLKSPMQGHAIPRMNGPSPFISPPKSHAADMASSPGSSFDESRMRNPALVSLPQGALGLAANRSSWSLPGPQTKHTDECVWDEPEFGSSPTVGLPKIVYPMRPDAGFRVSQNARLGREMVTQFTSSTYDYNFEGRDPAGVHLCLPTWGQARKVVPWPHTSTPGRAAFGSRKFDKKRLPARRSDVGEHGSNPPRSEVDRRRSSSWAKPSRGPPRDGQNDRPHELSTSKSDKAGEQSAKPSDAAARPQKPRQARVSWGKTPGGDRQPQPQPRATVA